jgi:putative phage-type endonuclease
MKLYEGTKAVAVHLITPDQFSAQRRGGVGGSDISAIAGINPWKSALTLYYEKRGELPDTEESEAMYWGKRLESTIAEEAAQRLGLEIAEVPYILAHPEHDCHRAQIDRLILDSERGNGVLEVKNMGHWSSQKVRESEGEDAIPDHYLLQVQWQLHVTGLSWGVFAALMGGSEFRSYEVQRDDTLIAGLVKLADDFWRCVQNGTPPAADGSDSTTATLKQVYATPEQGKQITLSGEFDSVIAERAELTRKISELSERKKELDNQIKLAMGDAETALCGPWRLTLKAVNKKEYTVKASTYRELRVAS